MASPRSTRRLTLALGSAVAALGVAAAAVVGAERAEGWIALLAAAGVVLTVLALGTRRVLPLHVGIAALAVAVAAGRDAPPVAAVTVGAGLLLLAAELAAWSFELRVPMAADPGADTPRWTATVALAVAGVAAAALVVTLAALGERQALGGPWLAAAAVVSVLAVVGVLRSTATSGRRR